MGNNAYRPWRSDEQPDDLMAGEVSDRWRQLLSESRHTVQQLREATQATDRKLAGSNAGGGQSQLHDQILERLKAFEQRLQTLESQIATAKAVPRRSRLAQPNQHRPAA
jgi:hypothetical protein